MIPDFIPTHSLSAFRANFAIKLPSKSRSEIAQKAFRSDISNAADDDNPAPTGILPESTPSHPLISNLFSLRTQAMPLTYSCHPLVCWILCYDRSTSESTSKDRNSTR